MTRTRIFTIAAVLIVGAAIHLAFATPSPKQTDCESGCRIEKIAEDKDFTESDQKVITYICDRIIKGTMPRFTAEEISKTTGVTLSGMNEAKLTAGVFAELNRRNFSTAGFS